MRILPQSQCGQCGFAGCWPYARAIVRGEAPPDLCAPGGMTTATALAALHAGSGPMAHAGAPKPAQRPLETLGINVHECIGCGRCLPVCPVDAIAGAVGFLHAVLADSCTGCQLCLAACPADSFVPAPGECRACAATARYRYRYARKRRRLARALRPESRRVATARKQREITEALERVRKRRGWQAAPPTLE